MSKDQQIRLQADRVFVEQLCVLAGKTASAIALSAGMAPTTLNRYVSKKIMPSSTLKDSTIEKIADVLGLDGLVLLTHRKFIEQALLAGQVPPRLGEAATPSRGLSDNVHQHSHTAGQLSRMISDVVYGEFEARDLIDALEASQMVEDLTRNFWGEAAGGDFPVRKDIASAARGWIAARKRGKD